MYRKILVALENSAADQALLPHVTELARRLQSALLLVHVADGWAARNFNQLKLAESEEMKADRAYLQNTKEKLQAEAAKLEAQLSNPNFVSRAPVERVNEVRERIAAIAQQSSQLQQTVENLQ